MKDHQREVNRSDILVQSFDDLKTMLRSNKELERPNSNAALSHRSSATAARGGNDL